MPLSHKFDATTERQIAEWIVKAFPTSSHLNTFLADYVWPLYRQARAPTDRRRMSGEFYWLDGKEMTIREVSRLPTNARVLRKLPNGKWLPVRKLRGYGFTADGVELLSPPLGGEISPQSTP